ncbi:g8088 [Coccomyxa viridis]|uniref:G8088 protein n=1 Tax=Coccomyxa viridis TaxID=1274662 RepID=A0ABP1G234_9CHLO
MNMVASTDRGSAYSVGSSVRLETTLGETVEGEVFACDDATELVVLKQSTSSSKLVSLRVLKATCIEKVLYSVPPREAVEDKLPPIDERRSLERRFKAVAAAQERSERQGVGVSKEGQQLFDCFYKTMPCKWQGKTILVLGEVKIKEPYDMSCVNKAHPDVPSVVLDRVVKMLKAERERLAMD